MASASWSPGGAASLAGRHAVVTGATGGLGLAVALGLAGRGAQVALAGRRVEAGARAQALVREAGRAGGEGGGGDFMPLDLADLSSVSAFAETLSARPALHLLVNNAGVMAPPRRELTADGFERQIGVNHLGHFALTAQLLAPLLRAGAGARVVSVSSLAHRRARLDLDDLQGERGYRPFGAYAQSKLAVLLFARELQRRCIEHGWALASLAAHPGWAATEIVRNGPGGGRPGLGARLMQRGFDLLAQSAAGGALPVLYAAMAPDVRPGGYYGPSGRAEIRGGVSQARVMPQGLDEAAGRALWTRSEELTGLRFA